MGIFLFEHNKQAYEQVVSMLNTAGKAAVIHPTGTGKSFIAFKLCEDNPGERILWLSPSEYIYKTQLENLRAAGGEEPGNVRFCTYAKLTNMDIQELRGLTPDIIIFDEFHRCGAKRWGGAVNRLLALYPDAQVLGLSATAVRYLDNQRDMADELFEGNVASEMTLGEAIVRGILAAPKYVMAAFIYNNELERIRRRIDRAGNPAVRDAAERYYEALRRALEKADGLDEIFNKHMEERTGKYLVFTSNYEAMREAMSHVSEWFGKVDAHPHVYSLYSLDSSSTKSLADFKADNDTSHLRLLFCIDALNEGIHVESISGVILFRPTESPIVYKQQIGRALAAGKGGTPEIFDIVNNFDGLYSIGALEEEMRAAVTYYNYFGDGGEVVTERFKVIDEVRECRELFEKIEGALTATWECMYEYAREYYAANGNLDVPKRYKTADGHALGAWLQTQRQVRAGDIAGNLDEERIAKLDAIGMRWESVNDLSWERHFAACVAYREEHGDLDVPFEYVAEDGMRLGLWIRNVRLYRRNGIKSNYFTPERERQLDSLGMIWDSPDYIWNRNYEAARSYYKKHGDLNVPAGHVENGVKLYNWLVDLKKMYRGEPGRRGTLTSEQIAELEAIGMRWKSRSEAAWDRGYGEAKKYFETNRTLNIPVGYVTPTGYKLGVWLSKCREKYAKGKLTKEQISALETIGMVWDRSRRNDWDECFEKAKAYYAAHGDVNVPPDYVVSGVWLGKWISEQRLILRGERPGKNLSPEQEEKLRSISITAEEPRDARWRTRYGELRKYYEAHGDVKLPIGYTDSGGQDLYIWLVNQRMYERTGKLSPWRRELLTEVGAFSG